ncbi:MAG: hypothetical protein R6X19_06780 [Kiritimatiellia bacterium]
MRVLVKSSGEYYDDFSTIAMDVNGDGRPDFVSGDVAGNGRMDIVLKKGWLECPAEPPVVPEKEPENLRQLREALSETREYVASAEEILNRVSREKITNELALLKKIREAEALSREFAGKTKAREDEVAALHDAIRGLETKVGERGDALAAKDEECRAVRSGREAETAPLLAKAELHELAAALKGKEEAHQSGLQGDHGEGKPGEVPL